MRKLMITLAAGILMFSVLFQTQAQAAAPTTTVYVNGVKLATDQAPKIVGSRILLPLRAIFEVLDSTVDWNAKAKTVTATRDDTTIVLKLGSKTATINNETVTLDVAAQLINGRTMIPVRFVSEAMGAEVDWNAGSKSVYIKTSGIVSPPSNVYAQVVGKKGNGSDLEISFSKSNTESAIDHYRILVVKASNSSSFGLATALSVNSRNYTTAVPYSENQTITLSAQARDVNGDLLQVNQAYAVYVLAIGKANGQNALSQASSTVMISGNAAAPAVTNVKANDVNDYGDGRDLQVSFTKASDETKINHYRVLVVKSVNAGNFSLAKAVAAASSNYTAVNKSGSNFIQTLSSGARDTDGAAIASGVSYRVYVLSVSNDNNTGNYTLSGGSADVVLTKNSNIEAASSVVAFDVSDYNDGRDMRVIFNKAANESKISQYRIFVVKTAFADSFSLSTANALPSTLFTAVNKTGNNITQSLPSGAKDTTGDKIVNGASYKVFVLSVGTNDYKGINSLSAPSPVVMLTNSASLTAVTDVKAADISDYKDARDMFVSFNKAYDETNISHYRVLVVKTANANNFTLNKANEVSSSNYTQVNKTNNTLSLILASGTRDVNGDTIRNGVSYRVFVLSVGGGSFNGSNALSSPSPAVTLEDNTSIGAATSVTATDVNDHADGRDLLVTFNKASDERNISHYRVLVVKTANASNFTLLSAASVTSSNYTTVNKTGSNLRLNLDAGARDVDGAKIQNGVSYRVFILTVGAGTNNGNNALSAPSADITLNTSIASVANLSAKIADNGKIEVNFDKPQNQTGIAYYAVMIVPSDSAFDLKAANNAAYFIQVNGGTGTTTNDSDKDVNGAAITSGSSYKVYVLSVAASGNPASNALSGPSGIVTP
ncbi:copper amine oxidase N-terminal domain-containing protein [Paenibacillus nasutitermitis]|uniref:Copper amine oxidase-like N-terminal domain-containing protein n=1 Tax=Paenibacillus nasutitermitis TaxID=1652958 RepID=A0A916YQW0_9BACL|nr:copper amine oxidase N-terminal domain-containing protein [Paenibacillus nasutitermitis]GGD55735.1 hypothetical protein GCM10010911_11800 [Paenibacillus nasutitermitis]